MSMHPTAGGPIDTLTHVGDARANTTGQVMLPESASAGSVAAWLVLIVFIALAARLLMFTLGPATDVQRAYYPDSHRYVELGTNLANTGQFGLAMETSGKVHVPLAQKREAWGQAEPYLANGLRPEVFRTPGYPFLIAVVEWLKLPMHALLLLQCLIAAISVLLVFAIGNAVLESPRAALLAATIVALHPADIMAPNALLSETLFTALLLGGIWIVASPKVRTIWNGAAGGFLIGLSVLVRPVSLFVAPIVAVWMVARERNLKALGGAALLIIAAGIPVAAWMVRNDAVGFGPRVSSVPYINGYFYTTNYMNLTADNADWAKDWPAGVDALLVELDTRRTPDEDAFAAMQRLTLERITENPTLYAAVMQRSVLKFFTDHSMPGMYSQLGLVYEPTGLKDQLLAGDFSMTDNQDVTTALIALGWMGLNALLLVGTLLGLVILLWRRQWSTLFLLGGLLLYFVFATQANGLERFRVPVLGIQAIIIASLFAPAPIRPVKPKKQRKRKIAESFDREAADDLVETPSTGRPI